MRTKALIVAAYCFLAVAMLLRGLAADHGGSVNKLVSGDASFDVVSFKYSGSALDHAKVRGGNRVTTWQPLELKGVRLVGDAPLSTYIEFACHNLVTPYRQECPRWMSFEYYRVEAVAPSGTTVDVARTMLRNALTERLAFRYHVADREMPVYFLRRSDGDPKLRPSRVGASRDDGVQSTWRFKSGRVQLIDFARFLSSVAFRDVIDQTGIQGYYEFDVDLTRQLEEGPPQEVGPALAVAEAKRFGLKLTPGNEIKKILVADGATKLPTEN